MSRTLKTPFGIAAEKIRLRLEEPCQLPERFRRHTKLIRRKVTDLGGKHNRILMILHFSVFFLVSCNASAGTTFVSVETKKID